VPNPQDGKCCVYQWTDRPVLVLLMSAFMKVVKPPPVAEDFAHDVFLSCFGFSAQ
jgi:hypothetical protein